MQVGCYGRESKRETGCVGKILGLGLRYNEIDRMGKIP